MQVDIKLNPTYFALFQTHGLIRISLLSHMFYDICANMWLNEYIYMRILNIDYNKEQKRTRHQNTAAESNLS